MQMKGVGMALALVGGALAGGTAEAGARVVVRPFAHPVRPALVARPVYVAPRPVYAPVYASGAVVVRTPVLRVSVGEVVVERRGYGRLHVNVDPERARVYIDGRYQGRGDLTRSLRAGRHTVRVVLNDGRTALETVAVDTGRVTVARLDLNG